jgi:hypothetical protein
MPLEAQTKAIEIIVSKKPEEPVDPGKVTKDLGAPDPTAEVEGRGFYRWVECWHCHDLRRIYWEYPGEVFVCGNCGVEYIPNPC